MRFFNVLCLAATVSAVPRRPHPPGIVLQANQSSHTTVNSDECQNWCAGHPDTWRTKCAWDTVPSDCGGCEECSEPAVVNCKLWCDTNLTGSNGQLQSWHEKCAFKSNDCSACTQCAGLESNGVQQCQSWCEASTTPWATKCTWVKGVCSACSKCDLTPSPPPSPSPPPPPLPTLQGCNPAAAGCFLGYATSAGSVELAGVTLGGGWLPGSAPATQVTRNGPSGWVACVDDGTYVKGVELVISSSDLALAAAEAATSSAATAAKVEVLAAAAEKMYAHAVKASYGPSGSNCENTWPLPNAAPLATTLTANGYTVTEITYSMGVDVLR